MKTLKEIIIGVLIGLIIAQPLAAMAETREQYIDHTKNTYNPAAGQRATNLQGTVQNKIVNTWAGRNPEVFYGGNSWGGVIQADISDLGRIASRFFSCVNFSFSWRWRFTWRRGLQWKFRMGYRYPIQKIHTHHYKQNRYLPSGSLGFYSLLNPSPIYQSIIYPLINLQTQFRVLRSDLSSKYELVRHGHIPRLSLPIIGNYPANYTGFSNKKFREQSGIINSTSLQEYHVGPTGFNEIFVILKLLIPYLRSLLEITGCQPPNRIPYHLTSDSFLTLLSTRVAWPFLVTAKDDFLNSDYNTYLLNPGQCTRFQLNFGEIPQDMYDNVAPTLNLVPQIYPELMDPDDIRDEDFADYRRICHRKLGAIFPYTTNETAGTHEIVTAQVSVIKALRWAFGIYLTTMHRGSFPKTNTDYVTSNPRNWYAQQDGEPGYYNLDLNNDRIQRLYPSSTSCQTFGNLAPKFAGANTQKTAGKDGVYSFAHWKYFSCESGWRAPVMPSPW